MTQEKLKQFLDACFDAKRLIEKLPDLPDGMKPGLLPRQRHQQLYEHNAAEHHQAGAGTGGEKSSRETGG